MKKSKSVLTFPLQNKIRFIVIFFSIFFSIQLYSQDLPIGYISYFSQKADNLLFISSITSCTPEYWNISNDKKSITLYPVRNDSGSVDSLHMNMGIVKDMIFGEYIMEFDFYSPINSNAENSGFCFAGPVKSANTYYTYLFGNDSVTFYFINHGIPERIGAQRLKPAPKSWNHVRITRDILKRSVTITLNNNPEQQVTFTHPRLVMGYVGFGTLFNQSSIRNINIWAPTVITDTTFCCY